MDVLAGARLGYKDFLFSKAIRQNVFSMCLWQITVKNSLFMIMVRTMYLFNNYICILLYFVWAGNIEIRLIHHSRHW